MPTTILLAPYVVPARSLRLTRIFSRGRPPFNRAVPEPAPGRDKTNYHRLLEKARPHLRKQQAAAPAGAVSFGQFTTACSQCTLGALCPAGGLGPRGRQRLARILDWAIPIREGGHLYRVGDPLKALYIVHEGCFKTYVVDGAGREQVLGFHLPGDVLGLDALFPEKYGCNAMALEPGTVCVLGCHDLGGLIEALPDLNGQMLRLMSKEIGHARALSGNHSADERLAAFLLSLSARYGQRGRPRWHFVLSMARRDIANYLRLATETVSRVFARFQKQGLIAVERRQINVTDPQGLERLAESLRLH